MENSFFKNKRDNFLSAIENIEQVQKELLQKILCRNAETQYGRIYNFDKFSSIKEFQDNVPITTYENYVEYIKKISLGEDRVLTADEIKLLEPSSGSTSASKLIPFTVGLKEEFNRGIEPWLSDLYINMPELKTSPAYWSITPSLNRNSFTKSGIKIGFDNDAQYLSDEFAYLLQSNLFIPDFISEITDIEEFKYVTLLYLLSEEKLTFISIWNPSLFIILLEKLENESETFIEFLESNKLPENSINQKIQDKIKSTINYSKERKQEVIEILSKKEIQFSHLWKSLKLISCWADSNAKPYAAKLQSIFLNVYIQPKGLLATEGIMTIPIENIGKLPCVNSHFFEFIEQNSKDSSPKLLHELCLNKEYSIVLTTSGGLYRYEIGDIVKVYDVYKNGPCLEFVGKKDNISDYFGEKLNEIHINTMLNEFKISQLTTFYLFAPVKTNNSFFYTLYIEPKSAIAKESLIDLEDSIERELLKNFNYKYCRELNQIQKFKIFLIDENFSAVDKYLKNCVKKGIKLGDIKPSVFSNTCNWEFNGMYTTENREIVICQN